MLLTLRRQWRQLYLWLNRARLYRDLEKEIGHHFLLREEEYAKKGFTRQAALAKSRKDLGNITLAKEESRDVWGFPSIDRLMQDIRYPSASSEEIPALAWLLSFRSPSASPVQPQSSPSSTRSYFGPSVSRSQSPGSHY
jgi:hypothetical protein